MFSHKFQVPERVSPSGSEILGKNELSKAKGDHIKAMALKIKRLSIGHAAWNVIYFRAGNAKR